jgi:urease accessory protein
MDSLALSSPLSAPQRAFGRLHIAFRRRDAVTALERLRQEGCLKARMPRGEPGGIVEAVLLNTAGGVTGGDDLGVSITLAAGARAVITTQAAERFYRASAGSHPARIATRLTAETGADLAWLPQETILFEGCRVHRRLEVDLAPDARFLGIETLLFGRVAMGEVLRDAAFRERIALRIGGRLVFQDMLRLEGDIVALMARAAVAADAVALATILCVRPEAERLVEPLRAMLGTGRLEDGAVEAGVSAWNGLLLMRLLAPDGVVLRRATMAALDLLRDTEPLPRVWRL